MTDQIRPEVTAFLSLAPLPASADADEVTLKRLEDALAAITFPVSRAEAIQLSKAFGPDELFGLAWTLLHLIESAPGGPPLDAIADDGNDWISRIRERSRRGRQ